MRRMHPLAAFGLAVVATLALGGGASAQGPAEDSVTGTASGPVSCIPPGCFRVTTTFDAHSGRSGENPRGTVRVDGVVTTPPFGGYEIFGGRVACLNVVGTRATIGVVGEVGPFEGATFIVEDAAQDKMSAIPGPADVTCPAPGAFGLTPIAEGDIVVVDAPPLPTSKDQCENGGWRNFPGFKNQGNCVSWVATHGNNPPGG
jgi:hypothetical protein